MLSLPLLASFIAVHEGWRTGLFTLGAAMFVLINIFAILMVRGPELKGLRPDGFSPSVEDQIRSVNQKETAGWRLTDALRTVSLWIFVAGFVGTLLNVTVPDNRPNIVLILVNDGGFAGLGIMGEKIERRIPTV